MSCKYDLEDIIKYFEGDFSKEKFDEISAHLEKCKRCRTMYSSLTLTKQFFDVDVEYKGNVLSSIEGLIDKNRYRCKNPLHFLDKLVFNNVYILKVSIPIAIVSICIIFSIHNGNVHLNSDKYISKNTAQIPEEQNISIEPTASSLNNNDTYIKKGHFAQSPNGEMTAEVIREKDLFFDSILITDKNKENFKIILENIMYTSIESFSWIDNNRIGLCGEINPSVKVYVVIDTNGKSIVGEYDGIGFVWNKDKNKLYYIMTGFEVIDKIVDNEGNTYYEAESGTSIIGTIAITEDEEKFAFFVNENSQNKRKLILAKMGLDKKLKKELEIDAQFGSIKFNGSNSLSVTGIDGSITNYDLE